MIALAKACIHWRTLCRLHKVGSIFFGNIERRVYAAWAYTLVVAVVTFGAACGIVAAALTFGAYEHYAASYGQRLRTAASYVSTSTNSGSLPCTSTSNMSLPICPSPKPCSRTSRMHMSPSYASVRQASICTRLMHSRLDFVQQA